jgi:hypothetical protein
MSLRFRASCAAPQHSTVGSGGRVLWLDPTLTANWALALGALAALFYSIGRPNPTGSAAYCLQRALFSYRPRLVDPGKPKPRPETGRAACNNAAVSRGSDAQDSMLASFGPVNGREREGADLGPISPELALVDHVLAERARALLPDPAESPRLRPAPAGAERPRAPVVRRPAPAPSSRSTTPRLKRVLVLSAILFAAGAASVELLGQMPAPSPPALLELRPGTANEAVTEETRRSAPRRTTRNRHETSSGRREPRSSRARQVSTRRGKRPRRAPITWVTNVLGVTAGVDARGVRLAWQAPADSARVVVVRALDGGKPSVVVFRGRATSVRDTSPRPCSTYRYTIVNYDRGGRRSTGVPTSVVTAGCAGSTRHGPLAGRSVGRGGGEEG